MDISQETLDRLEGQITWYGKTSTSCQRWYKACRGIVIISAALIPLSVNLPNGNIVAACLGVLIVVVEGFQQLNQYHKNWTTYRSTCESLKHEKYLWIGKAGPYTSSDNPNAMLAERIEALISQEHANGRPLAKKQRRNLLRDPHHEETGKKAVVNNDSTLTFRQVFTLTPTLSLKGEREGAQTGRLS